MARKVLRRLLPTFSRWNRARKARHVVAIMKAKNLRSALLVGATGGWAPWDNIVEHAAFGEADFVVGCGFDKGGSRPWMYVACDGRKLPFRDDAFDLVMSNAVIEHVGQETEQRTFAAEHARVGRTWVITTPNKWFPVESHTQAVLRHWSPSWRATRREFTRLMSRREFAEVLPGRGRVRGHSWSPTFLASSD